jgi:hypothetical protein
MAHGTRITRDAAGATSRISRIEPLERQPRSAAGSAEGRLMIRYSSSGSGRGSAESCRIRMRRMLRPTTGGYATRPILQHEVKPLLNAVERVARPLNWSLKLVT